MFDDRINGNSLLLRSDIITAFIEVALDLFLRLLWAKYKSVYSLLQTSVIQFKIRHSY